MSVSNLFSHTASCVTEVRALYTASVVDSAPIGCVLLNQLMAATDIINRFPVVKCHSFTSPALKNLTRQLPANFSFKIYLR